MLKGIGVSDGIGLGPVFKYIKTEMTIPDYKVSDINAEKEKFDGAVASVIKNTLELQNKAKDEIGDDEAAIFEAHAMILQDQEMIDAVHSSIDQGNNAAAAVKEVFDGYVTMFESMDDDYFRERASDMSDISHNILNELLGVRNADISKLPSPCIIVAHDLTPSDTAKMDIKNVRGILTEVGGRTAHTAIMARAMEIPAVVGCQGALNRLTDGEVIAIYGDTGCVEFGLSSNQINEIEASLDKITYEKEILLKYNKLPSITKDGHSIEISSNIGTPQEAEKALKVGADGIGLFRSEFLYMDREALPTEEEQFLAYKEAVTTLGKPVIVRTLDVGGDKKLPALPLPKEDNPFLGYRAIRISLDRSDLFITQLRALLRASAFGDIRIMFPMISSLDELLASKASVEIAKTQLKEEKIPFNEDIKVGIMIEIPSAAVMSDILAKHCDFFSIGTNDLIQYTVAVDRGNESISKLYSQYHPAVLRLINLSISNAHNNGIHCGMCGEAAGDPTLVPLLLGMGLDEFSMSSSSVLKVRKLVSELNYQECTKIVYHVLEMSTASEVQDYLNRYIR